MDNGQKQHQDGLFWIGLFFGGLLAVVLMVLLGTEKGKKMIEKLQDEGLGFLDEARDSIADKIEKMETKSEDLVERGQELLSQGKAVEEQLVRTVMETKPEAVENVVGKVEEALTHIEQLQERGRKSTADLRKQLFKNIPKRV